LSDAVTQRAARHLQSARHSRNVAAGFVERVGDPLRIETLFSGQIRSILGGAVISCRATRVRRTRRSLEKAVEILCEQLASESAGEQPLEHVQELADVPGPAVFAELCVERIRDLWRRDTEIFGEARDSGRNQARQVVESVSQWRNG